MLNKHIAITALVLICLIIFFELTDTDIWVQDHFFDFETQRWILDRDNLILKFLLYDGIKKLFVALVVVIFLSLLFFRNTVIVEKYKHGLLIVGLCAIIVPAFIGSLKAVSNTPCPKNITRYGGSYPYVTAFEKYPESFQQNKKIKCYPAGHASGGFALLSLFFLFKRKRNQQIALLSVMSISWIIGGYKMLIGDHFLSHTIVTMLLAWLIILIVTKIIHHKSIIHQ